MPSAKARIVGEASHYFERFLAEYEERFEEEYGFFRPIIKEVVERYFDCGNPRCGFAPLSAVLRVGKRGYGCSL